MVRFNGTQDSFQSLPSNAKFDVVRDFWIQSDRKMTDEVLTRMIKKIHFFVEGLKDWKDRGVIEDQVSDYLSSKVALRRVGEKCEEYLMKNFPSDFAFLRNKEDNKSIDARLSLVQRRTIEEDLEARLGPKYIHRGYGFVHNPRRVGFFPC